MLPVTHRTTATATELSRVLVRCPGRRHSSVKCSQCERKARNSDCLELFHIGGKGGALAASGFILSVWLIPGTPRTKCCLLPGPAERVTSWPPVHTDTQLPGLKDDEACAVAPPSSACGLSCVTQCPFTVSCRPTHSHVFWLARWVFTFLVRRHLELVTLSDHVNNQQ